MNTVYQLKDSVWRAISSDAFIRSEFWILEHMPGSDVVIPDKEVGQKLAFLSLVAPLTHIPDMGFHWQDKYDCITIELY